MKRVSLFIIMFLAAVFTGCEFGMTDYYDELTQAPVYAVTYDRNGATSGMVPVDDTDYRDGFTVTVKGNEGNLTKSGTHFCGWTCGSTGGETYTRGQTFVIGKDPVILYAKWTANAAYKVTYDANGATSGKAPVDNTYYEDGKPVIMPDAGTLLKTGFDFYGWNVNSSGIGNTYTAGSEYEMGGSDVTLYAKWYAGDTFFVLYNNNNPEPGVDFTSGSEPEDTRYIPGDTVTVRGNTGNLMHPHYTLTSWNTASNGSGTTRYFNSSFTMPGSNVQLYAIWTAKNYNLSFDANGGTGTMTSQQFTYKQTAAIKANTFTREGYSFAHWAKSPDGYAAYSDKADYTMEQPGETLYAKWFRDRNWRSVTVSHDGTHIAAVVSGGYIWTSADSGATWTNRSGSGSRNWRSIAGSSNGTNLAAVVDGGYIYTSRDSGATWIERTGPGSKNWKSIASSDNGDKLVASSSSDSFMYVYTSTNYGAEWTRRTGPSGVYSIASSYNGTNLAALAGDAYIYTSTNSGENWDAGEQPSFSIGGGTGLAGTSDCATLFACFNGYNIWYSGDFAENWTERTSSGARAWSAIACSPSAAVVAAAVDGGYIYTSTNSGGSWTERQSAGSRNWRSIACNNGTMIVAVAAGNGVWISTNSGETWNRKL